ncbi:endolytic transglycosylase MltG [Lentzea sp. BCCO 10_0856]|uniref:Endolytic murein transglycosylase n=1 Tax=Lentzea miocenica TaxID=3095431 RepID=A0ABU4T0B8_9PSEU|nr:endolytic transglycosylase MltG [Lentzea sp. BCCO 10_0856]MDX8031588.1 endolytic transglycosylase MltG [Lentzea sp. BCCO 10_0856]
MSDDLGLFTDPEVDERRPLKRDRVARDKAKKRKKTVLWLVVALVLAVGMGGAYYGYRELRGIGSFDDYAGSGETDAIVEVQDGDVVSKIASTLYDNGVVASARAFIEASKTDARVTSIQPGFYLMKTKMSGQQAVARMVDPKTRVPAVQIVGGLKLTDIQANGKTVPGIYSQLAAASCTEKDGQKVCLSVEEIKAAAEQTDPVALGVPDWALADVKRAEPQFRLEGLIMRGVYQVKPGVSAVELIRSVIVSSAQKLQGAGIPGGTVNTGFRPYEVLVMASLIEKEAIEKDFPEVSQVIYNRLKKPMALQFDSTINYKNNQPHIRTSDADREANGPYNTYINQGLTPTPIGSPSQQAVAAALKPEGGDILYFVKCQADGTSCFAKTFDEHNANDQKAQRDGIY